MCALGNRTTKGSTREGEEWKAEIRQIIKKKGFILWYEEGNVKNPESV